ncbi:MAG: ribosome maturation factor RimM [Solirubrobacteraceae bacterium]
MVAAGEAEWLRAGVVGRPHGLDGSFHVNLPVAGLLSLGGDVWIGGESRRIERLAGHDARPIVRLDGCSSRESAEQLRGRELLVARDRAPALEEDEWWASDLEGCAVRDGDREVGVVARLLELPSCEVLEVKRRAGGSDLLVPLVRDAVRTVDTQARVIDVDLRFLGES